MRIDPFDYVKRLQPGIMICGVGGPTKETEQCIFLIREEDQYIKRLGDDPIVEIRVGLIDSKAIIMMVRLNNDPDMTYDGWINILDPGNAYNRLFKQDNLIFKFFNAEKEVRTIATSNSIKNDLKLFKLMIGPMAVWDMEEFDEIKMSIYEQYSPSQLWEKLKPH